VREQLPFDQVKLELIGDCRFTFEAIENINDASIGIEARPKPQIPLSQVTSAVISLTVLDSGIETREGY
jgi:hypothetical protein